MDDQDFRAASPGWQIVLSVPGADEMRATLVGWTWREKAGKWLPTYYRDGRMSAVDQDQYTRQSSTGTRVQVVPDHGLAETFQRHAEALRDFTDVAESHTYALRHFHGTEL